MSFEDFNFVNRTHCPHCQTNMIIIDRRVVSCPLCELMKRDHTSGFDKKRAVLQELC
ncbi:MAG: hypothetical protein ACW972_09945 [Promethearchaeota archaeon]|jgi:hypothetical protein